jgi:hypothetical protein
MQTERLVEILSHDLPRHSHSLSAQMVAGIGAATFGVAAIFLGLYGWRDVGFEVLGLPRFVAKITLVVVLVAALWSVARRAAGPIRVTARDLRLLKFVFVTWVVALMAEAFVTPPNDWRHLFMGANNLFCLMAIPTIGLPILIATLAILRQAAPANPWLAGALSGAFSGSVASLIYAVHCPDDSPFFISVWYGLGIAALTILGLIGGRSLLKW